MSAPILIDLFCGLGGWSKGFLAEGYRCIGFDIERHRYPVATGAEREQWTEYPGELVLQDVHTIHGRQFRNAACIVASPPCQEFSYMAMPWTRAKQIAAALRGAAPFPEDYAGSRTAASLTALFDACFRIQREASTAAGRRIPMLVENVRGAQEWVGKAKANYGSFYLWGDVESVGGRIVAAHQVRFGAPAVKAYRDGHVSTAHLTNRAEHGRKEHQKQPVWFNDDKRRATKCGGDWFGSGDDCSLMRSMSSRSPARKAASAQIAEIPSDLARWAARQFRPAIVHRSSV